MQNCDTRQEWTRGRMKKAVDQAYWLFRWLLGWCGCFMDCSLPKQKLKGIFLVVGSFIEHHDYIYSATTLLH